MFYMCLLSWSQLSCLYVGRHVSSVSLNFVCKLRKMAFQWANKVKVHRA